MQLKEMSDDALIAQIGTACRAERRFVADVVSYLVEVEDRRLDLRSGSSSLFDYCVRSLGMSEGAAFRRINAARLVRRFPCLLAKLSRGELHLSGLVLLRDYFTNDNVEELAAAASHRSESKLRKLIARRWPRSAVPERIDKLRRSRIDPLSPEEYLVQFTMRASTYEKLQHARDMLRHSHPDGDIASVLDRALDLLITKLERERRGAAKGPRPSTASSTTEISRAARREVFARDGEQCTYRSEVGERCPSRGFLELDHAEARSFGGGSDPSNLRVLCRAHNRLHAEEDFGKEHVAEQIEFRRRMSSDAVVPVASVASVAASAAPSVAGSAAPSVAGSAAPLVAGSAAPSVAGSVAPSMAGSVAGSAAASVAASVAGSVAGSAAASAAAAGVSSPMREVMVPAASSAASAAASVAAAVAREVGQAHVTEGFEDYFRQRMSAESDALAASVLEAASDEGRAVHGLVEMGFARQASVRTVKSILARGGTQTPLVDILREAICVLAASR